MREFVRGACAALALAAFMQAGPARAAPLEAYGRLPNIEQAEISPTGALVALIATDGERRTVIVQRTSDRKVVLVSAAGSIKVRDLTWAGDDHLLVTVSTARRPMGVEGPRIERSMAEDIDLKTHNIRNLMDDVRGIRRGDDSMNAILGKPQARTIAGKPTAFVRGIYFEGVEGRPALFRVDLEHDRATLVQKGAYGAYDWIVDKDGAVIVEAGYVDRTAAWTLRVKAADGRWREVGRVASPISSPDLVGLTADGKSVVIDNGDDTTGTSWSELALESGEFGQAKPNPSDTTALVDAATGRIVGKHALVGDQHEYTFFEPQDAAVWRGIVKAFPGDIVTLASWSDDRKKIIVRVDSAELGPAYSFVDLNTGSADWLGGEFTGLTAKDIAARTPIHYKAADGLEISGYLTLPRGRAAKNLPLIVLAHGGPARRDEPGFDWWSQALASRGYAVLQANFRGSGGYGWGFEAAGFGQFGRKMQTDLSDGVRHLAAQGLIDPKRVCIVGASYGGYAALAAVTLDRGVYRCAVDYAGMSDLAMDVRDSADKGGRDSERYWLRFIGAKDIDDPVLQTLSPAFHTDRVDVPLLLIHGSDDTVVVFRQSTRMADAMKRAGKQVELVALKGEDHWLTSGATRLQMLQATVAFLEKNNPPE